MTEEALRNIRLRIEYEGTEYAGWQRQPKLATVQEMVAKAIKEALGEKVTVYGASRTDAGVHARGQVANFRTKSGLASWKIAHALNAHLPDDIAILEAADVPADFHAQFFAKGKWYRYSIRNSMYRSAIDRNFSHLVRGDLDSDAMAAGAKRLEGKKDFRSFGTEMDAKKNTVRTMRRVAVARNGPDVAVDVEGDGFLYNMVRTFVGTLIRIGKGITRADEIDDILAAKDRRRAGPVAPAKGLCLMRVDYA